MKIAGKPKNLKQNNSRAVFELLRHGENMTVSEIAERIRLSKDDDPRRSSIPCLPTG